MWQRLLCSMEVSRCLHPDRRVSSRQEFFCGKVRVKWQRNIFLVRCVSIEAASVILLSLAAMRCTEE